MTLRLIPTDVIYKWWRIVVYHVPVKFFKQITAYNTTRLFACFSYVLIPEILILEIYIILFLTSSRSVSVLYFFAPKSKIFLDSEAKMSERDMK
jgi:hypothetical protein